MKNPENSNAHPENEPNINPVGLLFFLIYVGLYSLFIVLNSFFPTTMGSPYFFGLNLSVSFGFALICGAVVLAFLYTFVLRSKGSKGT